MRRMTEEVADCIRKFAITSIVFSCALMIPLDNKTGMLVWIGFCFLTLMLTLWWPRKE